MFTDFYDWRLENSNWPRIRGTSDERMTIEFSVQGNFWEWRKPRDLSFLVINSLVLTFIRDRYNKFILQKGSTVHHEQLIRQVSKAAPLVFVRDIATIDGWGDIAYARGEFRNNAYYETRKIIYNPNLSVLVGKELYELTDEIAQEIDLWLGARVEANPEPVLDKLKIKAHGFDDKRSFRNCLN